MNRRTFAGLTLAAIGGVFAPRFGRWYRQGSGLLVPEPWVTVRGGAWDDPATWGRLTAPPAHGAVATLRHAVELPPELQRCDLTIQRGGILVVPDHGTAYFHHNVVRSTLPTQVYNEGESMLFSASFGTNLHHWRYDP